MSATVSTVAAPPTGDVALDILTTGYQWVLGADRTINWSISTGFAGESWGAPSQEALIAKFFGAILSTFSDYANIHFNYVGSFSSPSTANAADSQINFFIDGAASVISSDNFLAISPFPSAASNAQFYNGAAGDVIINARSAAADYSYEPGSEGWALILHEVGHALGLKHPHDDGSTGHPTFNDVGFGDIDVDWVTIMSYEDSNPASMKLFHPGTPMAADVLALIALYGPNISDNDDDGTFRIFADGVWSTLFSAGGVDVVSAADSIVGWSIELPYAILSSSVPYRVGMAAPLGELSLDAPRSLNWLIGDMENAEGSAQADFIEGNPLANRLNGGGGGDTIFGFSGNDTIDGGAGNDTIAGSEGEDYLRGNDGSDLIVGMDGNDDINGNKGNDNAGGGNGDDWVVGGQDDDFLTGDNGFDIVYGNLGNDTISGDNGADWVRGGQGDDLVSGGDGNDWLWGDRGNDTITGGAGADLFHSFSGGGIDRITDFKYSEGDRIILDDRTAFAVTQNGADAVITIGGADQVILIGVTASSLAADAIVYA
jgi:serralysin